MIFEQPFLNNFYDNPLSHTHIVSLFSLPLFLSLLLLSNRKREKKVVTKVIWNWLSKYHSSCTNVIVGSIFGCQALKKPDMNAHNWNLFNGGPENKICGSNRC